MSNVVYRLAAGVLAVAFVALGGETSAAGLREQLRQLRLEFTVHLLECEERRLRKMERLASKAAAGSLTLQTEILATHQDSMALDAQLVRPDLADEERAELDRLRQGPLRESDDRLRRRQDAAGKEESALRIRMERQRRAVEDLRRAVKLLREKEGAPSN